MRKRVLAVMSVAVFTVIVATGCEAGQYYGYAALKPQAEGMLLGFCREVTATGIDFSARGTGTGGEWVMVASYSGERAFGVDDVVTLGEPIEGMTLHSGHAVELASGQEYGVDVRGSEGWAMYWSSVDRDGFDGAWLQVNTSLTRPSTSSQPCPEG